VSRLRRIVRDLREALFDAPRCMNRECPRNARKGETYCRRCAWEFASEDFAANSLAEDPPP